MLRRSSILLAVEQATFNLQSERLVREADNPNRRTFRKPTEMLAWIGELLTSDEREAARRFLDEGNGLAKP